MSFSDLLMSFTSKSSKDECVCVFLKETNDRVQKFEANYIVLIHLFTS